MLGDDLPQTRMTVSFKPESKGVSLQRLEDVDTLCVPQPWFSNAAI